MKDFADRLKIAMAQSGMSQSALSEKSGCSKAAISQYLSGKNTPNPDKINLLAEALGVQGEFLMGFDVPPVKEAPLNVNRIGTRTAARCLGKSEQFVRIGLQRGLLPFGNAVPGTGSNWNYYINPFKFREYVGAERFNEFFGIPA